MATLLIPEGFATAIESFNKSKTTPPEVVPQLIASVETLIPILQTVNAESIKRFINSSNFNTSSVIKFLWTLGTGSMSKLYQLGTLLPSLINAINTIDTATKQESLVTNQSEALAYTWILRTLFDCITNAYASNDRTREEDNLFSLINQSQQTKENLGWFIAILTQQVNGYLAQNSEDMDTSIKVKHILHDKSANIKAEHSRTQAETQTLYNRYREIIDLINQKSNAFLKQFSVEEKNSDCNQLRALCKQHFSENKKIEEHLQLLDDFTQKIQQCYLDLQTELKALQKEANAYEPFLIHIKESDNQQALITQIDIASEVIALSTEKTQELEDACENSFTSLAATQAFLAEQQLLIKRSASQEKTEALLANLKHAGTIAEKIQTLDCYYSHFYETLNPNHKEYDQFIKSYKPPIPNSLINLLNQITSQEHNISYKIYKQCVTHNTPSEILLQIDNAINKINQMQDTLQEQQQKTKADLQQQIPRAHQQLEEKYYQSKLQQLHTFLEVETTTDTLDNFKQHYARIQALQQIQGNAEQINQSLHAIDYNSIQEQFRRGEIKDPREFNNYPEIFLENSKQLDTLEAQLDKLNKETKKVTADNLYYQSELEKRITLTRLEIEKIRDLNHEKETWQQQAFDPSNSEHKGKYTLLKDVNELLQHKNKTFSLRDKNLEGIQLSGFEFYLKDATNLNLKNANITGWSFLVVPMDGVNLENATLTDCQYYFAGSLPSFYHVKINENTNMDWQTCGAAMLCSNLLCLNTYDGIPTLTDSYLKNICRTIGKKQPDIITGKLILKLINALGDKSPQYGEDDSQFLIRQKQRARLIVNELLPYCQNIDALESIHSLIDNTQSYLRKERHLFRWFTHGNTNTWHHIISKIQNHLTTLSQQNKPCQLTETQAENLNKIQSTESNRCYLSFFRDYFIYNNSEANNASFKATY